MFLSYTVFFKSLPHIPQPLLIVLSSSQRLSPSAFILHVSCSGWDENGLHVFICLNTWSPVWKNCLGRFKKYGLVRGGVSLEGFKASKDSQYPQSIVSASCLQVKMWALSCSSQHEFCLLPQCSATMDSQPSETLSLTKHFQNCLGHGVFSQQQTSN